MSYASVRAAAQEAAKHGTLTPHQLAAFSALDQSLTNEQRQQFTELWRAQGSPAAAPDPQWLQPALTLLRNWEGLRLEAYRDAVGVATIGYGTTRVNGQPVQMGDKITREQAEAILRHDVLTHYGPGVFKLLPMADKWKPNQQAAIVSFAYNVGLGAIEQSTLRKRLHGGEDAVVAVTEELPRWNKGDNGQVLEGLVRRRAAEVELFVGGKNYGNPLQVPWFSQLDSATDQARRMCFSSSCAMLLAYLKPGSISGANADDQYLKRVQQYGDTTDPQAQLKALASYGVKATFTKKADLTLIENQIRKGIPVPCGYLHRGPVTAPSGGGHWLCVVGFSADHVIVHDPLGESDLINGTTLNSSARFARYSRNNWGKRWMVEGNGTGWAIVAER